MKNEEKRKERRKQTGEVFTPPELTNEILDKLPDEVWEEGKTFCDPSCGNGNMLLEVVKRKQSYNHDPIEIVKSIYGVDLMTDNVAECKERLLECFDSSLHSKLREILEKQIVCHDALTWDFENWKSGIKKYHKLF